MEVYVNLERGEIETPIKMAEAIIKLYKDRADRLNSEIVRQQQMNKLAQVAEHIQVYLKYH